LIGLLAYLEPKLWFKKQKLGKLQVSQEVTLAYLAKGRNSPAD